MALGCWVEVLEETPRLKEGQWELMLQWTRYHYYDPEVRPTRDVGWQTGYRLIWRRPNGKLLSGRANTRLPSRAEVDRLFDIAKSCGWGELSEEEYGETP